MKNKMYVPVALMAVFFFFNTQISFGQRQYRLTGRVTDSINNNYPIAGATLTIRMTGKSAITDAKGSFSFVVTDADLEYQLILSLPNGTDIPYRLQKKASWSATYKIYKIDFFLQEMIISRPDSDGDKIPDDIDKCPKVPGISRYNGCPIPDTDNDGINDEVDKCPTAAGPENNNGCPVTHTGIFKANWNFQTQKTLKVNNDEQEYSQTLSQVLKTNVVKTRIAPTKDAERLILDLNPQLRPGQKMNRNEEIVLPDFPEVGKKREEELQAQFEKNLSPDEEGIKDFLKAARLQNILYFTYPLPRQNAIEEKEFDYAFDLAQQATKGYEKDFKKYQTDILNSEMEQFNMKYLKMISAGEISKQDLGYLHSYSLTIIKLLEPIVEPGRNFYQEKKYIPQEQKAKALPPVKKPGGPSNSFFEEDEQLYYKGTKLLLINIYVFTRDKRAYKDSFDVYWLSPGMYDEFMRKEITLDDLKRKNKIPKTASATGWQIDPSFEYCFLAVPKFGNNVVAFTQVRGDAILYYSGNSDMEKPYAVPLYVAPQK